MSLSLSALTTDDVNSSFNDDCTASNTSDSKVIDLSSSECVYITGEVDGPSEKEDLFIIEIMEDINATYSITNDSTSDNDIEYAITTNGVCTDANTVLSVGASDDGNITGLAAGSFIHLALTTTVNQPSTYTFSIGSNSAGCGGDGTPGSVDTNTSADVIDTSITTATTSTAYNNSADTSSSGIKYVKTKRAGEVVPLTAV